MFDINAVIQAIAINALPVIFAITLHEAAHGYAAHHFGDNTAWMQGRISLNPLRHIDPVGTILIPILTLVFSGGSLLFGYAKPTPINPSLFRDPKRNLLWVSAAGPFANFLMACFWALMFKLSWLLPPFFSTPLALMGEAGVIINCVLMVLNLIPLPPFDGGRIAVSLLPHRLAWQFAKLEPWGFPILLVLLFSNILGTIMTPLVKLATGAIATIFGLY